MPFVRGRPTSERTCQSFQSAARSGVDDVLAASLRLLEDRFSDRHGYRGAAAEITVHEDAPDRLRYAIPLIAKDIGMSPSAMRRIICQELLVPPDPNNWSEYPNIDEEVVGLIAECPWYKVYDIAEALCGALAQGFNGNSSRFVDRLNKFFVENGIGWQMDGEQIAYRGSEAFTGATQEAVEILEQTGRSAAAGEIHEALRDISRRPEPDITGAIQHACAAMEATARDVMSDTATFGALAKSLDLPKPLDSAAEKLWGYASNNARHGLEGRQVDTPEAELIVSVACTICTYLAKRAGS